MPRAPVDPRRRCVPYEDWPQIDRRLWEAGTRLAHDPGDPDYDDLDDVDVIEDRSPHTIDKAAEGYGRWLGFLQWFNELDPDAHPADRVTPKRASAYFRLLKENENSPFTIVGRFCELYDALHIMAPGRDMRWVKKPGGRSIRSRLLMIRKPRHVYDCNVLLAWGIRLMDEALLMPAPQRRRVRLRDGLLIACMAARAFRLRTATGIALGEQVIREAAGWKMIFGPANMKNRRHLEYGLPDKLVDYFDRYVSVERPELLHGEEHDWLWVGWDGSRLKYHGIEKRIRWLSEKEFGKAFGPHTFRYALATTAAVSNPDEPGLGPAILGITAEVYQQSYNLAGAAQAAARFHAQLRVDRERTESHARRAFAEHFAANGIPGASGGHKA